MRELYATGLKQVLFPMAFVVKTINFSIQLAIYLPMVISSFTILYKLITSRHNILYDVYKKDY